MMSEEEEYYDIQVKDIQETITKSIISKADTPMRKELREILAQICEVLSRIEVSIEISNEDTADNLTVLIKEHRHLPDGKVVEPL